MKKRQTFGRRFDRFMRSELLAKILLVLFILSIVYIFFMAKASNADNLQSCISNCERYNMTFLKLEGDCFCLDTDDKPRQVPMGVIP